MKKVLFLASVAAFLLGSCSKDFTENNAQLAFGDSKIIAEYTINSDDTRTYLDENNKYVWDVADAIGLFVYNEGVADDTNAVFKNMTEGYVGSFTGSYDILDGVTYVGYYPYTQDTKLSEDGTIELSIPAKQNFNHEKKFGFTQNIAPAIATGEFDEDADAAVLNFSAVASYLRIQVVGIDEVKKVSLKVSGDYDIAGTGEVDVTAETPALSTVSGGKQIDLNCGKGVALNMNEPTEFWVVVPVLTIAQDGKWEIIINGDTDKEVKFEKNFASAATLKPNTAYNIKNDEGEPFLYNPTGAILLNDEVDFLKYAYLATYGWNDSWNDEKTKEYFFDDSNLKAAIVVADVLDFSKVNVASSFDEVSKMTAFEKAVLYDGFKAQNNTIATIGGKEEYDIDGNGATLKNLTVKGAALFDDGFTTTKAAGKATNLTLDAVVVDAEGLEAETVNLLTNRDYYNKLGSQFTEITINDNCKIVNAGEAETAVVGRVFTGSKSTITNGSDYVYANELNVMGNVTFVDEEADNYVVASYNTIKVHTNYGKGAIITVADKEAAEDLLDVIESEVYYSVVSVDEEGEATSYWTGFKAEKLTDDDYLTAEELALVIVDRKDTAAFNVTMTNNIDLMEKPLFTATTGSITVDGGEYTISNAYIHEEVAEDGKATATAYYSLFGSSAVVKNLNVKDITIDVTEGTKTPHIAAIVNTPGKGTTNVHVDGLTVKTAAVCSDGIGGLFGTLTQTSATAGTLTYVSNVSIDNVDTTGVEVEEFAYGELAGKFTVTVGSAEAFDVKNPIENKKPFGSVAGTIETAAVATGSNEYAPKYHTTTLNFVGFDNTLDLTTLSIKSQNKNNTYKLDGFMVLVKFDGQYHHSVAYQKPEN